MVNNLEDLVTIGRFGSTYEGLKPGRRGSGRLSAARFGSTYEGLKPRRAGDWCGSGPVLAVPMRA